MAVPAEVQQIIDQLLGPTRDQIAAGNNAAATNAAYQIGRVFAKYGIPLTRESIAELDPAIVKELNKTWDATQTAIQKGNEAGISEMAQLGQRRDDLLRQLGLTRDAQTGQLSFQKETSLRDLGVNRERLLRDLQFGHTGNLHDLGLLKQQILDDVAARGLWNSGAKVFEDQEAAYRLGRENEQYGYGVGDANQNYQYGTSDVNRGYDLQMAALNAALGNQEMMANRDYTQGTAQLGSQLLDDLYGLTQGYAGGVAQGNQTLTQAGLGVLPTAWEIYGKTQFVPPSPPPPPPPPPPPSGPAAVGGTVSAGVAPRPSGPAAVGGIVAAGAAPKPKPKPGINPIMLLK